MQKVTFRIKPNARTSSLGRSEDGTFWIRIAAPPAEGKANAALFQFLSKTLGIPKSSIKLLSGESGRVKTFGFHGPPIDWEEIVSFNSF